MDWEIDLIRGVIGDLMPRFNYHDKMRLLDLGSELELRVIKRNLISQMRELGVPADKWVELLRG